MLPLTTQIVLYDGFDPLDVIAPLEVFSAAGVASGGQVTVELVSAEGPREVPSGLAPVSLRSTSRFDPARARLVVLPGAAGTTTPPTDGAEPTEGSIPAILGQALSTGLPALFATAVADADVIVAGVCGGTLLLTMAGLAQGRPAVTHHLGMDLLAATGGTPVAARVVDDGDLVTSGGVTSGLDLALHLVDREVGSRIAHAVEALFAHERRGVVWRAHGPVPADAF